MEDVMIECWLFGVEGSQVAHNGCEVDEDEEDSCEDEFDYGVAEELLLCF